MDLGLIIVIAIALIGYVVQYFCIIVRMDKRLVKVELQSGLFWTMVEKNMTDILKQPTHLGKDELLDHMRDGGLTLEEAHELKAILEEEKKDPRRYRGNRQMAYIMILARLEMVILASR